MHMTINVITKALEILRRGGLVAIPTETVYGLAGDARNPQALKKIFVAKQRPMDHPLIVHVGEVKAILDWARDISPSAWLLANTFWPGPLTLILKKNTTAHSIITGGQDTIGLRIPNHPMTLALLKEFGGGVAAPSANRFGRISPTTAEAVREELANAVDFIVDGGQCDVGVESTIVDMSGTCPVILRPGMISALQIEEVLQQTVVRTKKKESPRVSGSMESHYAPVTPTRLMTHEVLEKYLQAIGPEEGPIAVLTLKIKNVDTPGVTFHRMPMDSKKYAHDLYIILRELDKRQFKQILIEEVPKEIDWEAIRDRLNRASL